MKESVCFENEVINESSPFLLLLKRSFLESLRCTIDSEMLTKIILQGMQDRDIFRNNNFGSQLCTLKNVMTVHNTVLHMYISWSEVIGRLGPQRGEYK